jgi:hypothetical protein
MQARARKWRDGFVGLAMQSKLNAGRVLGSFAVSNDRKTAKKHQCTAIMIIFRRNCDVV